MGNVVTDPAGACRGGGVRQYGGCQPGQADRRPGQRREVHGPESTVGEANSSQNAFRRGLRSEAVVIPLAESISDGTDSHTAVKESLAPIGGPLKMSSPTGEPLLWRARRVRLPCCPLFLAANG
jgi:hypothetical protein